MDKSNRLEVLDGVRGFATILVFLAHLTIGVGTLTNYLLPNYIWNLFAQGSVGVSFFFVLSGFLFGLLYKNFSGYRGFIEKRYLRIFPIYIVVALVVGILKVVPGSLDIKFLLIILCIFLAGLLFKANLANKSRLVVAYLILQLVSVILAILLFVLLKLGINLSQFTKDFFAIFANFTLTQSFYNPSSTSFLFSVGVFWSLQQEVIFYLVFPVLANFYIKNLYKNIHFAKKVIFALAVILCFYIIHFLTSTIIKLTYLEIYLSSGFIIGIFLSYVYAERQQFAKSASAVIFVNVVSILAMYLVLSGHRINVSSTSLNIVLPQLGSFVAHIQEQLLCAVVLLASLNSGTFLNKLFNNTWLRRMGVISYSFYLLHVICIDFVFYKLNINFLTPEVFLKYLLISAILAVVTASFAFLQIERLFIKSRPEIIKFKFTKVKLPFNFFILKMVIFAFVAILISTIQVYETTKYSKTQYLKQLNTMCTPSCTDNIKINNKKNITVSFYSREANLSKLILSGSYVSIARASKFGKKENTQVKLKFYNSEGVLLDAQNLNMQHFYNSPEIAFWFRQGQKSKNTSYKIIIDSSGYLSEADGFINLSDGSNTRLIYYLNGKDVYGSAKNIFAFTKNKLIVFNHNLVYNMSLIVIAACALQGIFAVYKKEN